MHISSVSALDAMRKAHEAEVQKEIAKFKTEYLKKVQLNHDVGALHKEHEYVINFLDTGYVLRKIGTVYRNIKNLT